MTDVNFLFISGMFRSGTTFIARALNAHSRVACASDPMRPLFNSYRHSLGSKSYKKKNGRYDPQGDYFSQDVELLTKILDSDLEVSLDTDSDELFEIIKAAAMPYSGLWARTLPQIKKRMTYRNIVKSFLDHIGVVYSKNEEVDLIAFKEVWTNEMVPSFLRSFEGGKAVLVIRDPRAVTASNNVTEAKYPVIFLARQWRKAAFLALEAKKMFPDRVMLVRYEELVANPKKYLSEICEFSEIPYDVNVLDSALYLDGDGKPWRQNTSYKKQGSKKITTVYFDKWREILDKKDCLGIELVCWDFMNAFGYERVVSDEDLRGMSADDFKRIEKKNLSGWIRKYSFDDDDDVFSSEFMKEKERYEKLYSGSSVPEDAIYSLQALRQTDVGVL